jgi:hypothetical protein
VELYATATRFPVIARSRWFEVVVGRHLTALAEGLPAEEEVAAERSWTGGSRRLRCWVCWVGGVMVTPRLVLEPPSLDVATL